MLKKVLIFIFCFVSITTYSQDKTELGFGIGAFNYTGDLNRRYNFLSHRPGATVFYKYNLTKALNFRAAITGGFIYGSDSKSPDPFSTQRATEFRVFAFEGSTIFEYNFMDLKTNDPLVFGTPYLFGGIGIAGFSGQAASTGEYSPIQPVIPFGVGVKYVYSPNWYFALEFGARALLFDYLDGVSVGDTRFKNYEYGNWFDNDLYYFVGLTATYSFYKIPCPRSPYR